MDQGAKRFPDMIEQAFEAWIGQDTWAEGSLRDERRFFDFVKAYCRFSRKSYSPDYLREAIMERWEHTFDANELKQKSKKYADLFSLLAKYEGVEDTREKKKYDRELFSSVREA